jgi:secreted trypsin-like serine protease
MNTKWVWRGLLCCSVALFIQGCTSGGGDDSGSDSSAANACADLNIRILNGEQCRQSVSPVVLIGIFANDDSFAAVCTGTLITPTQVLTAAHCLDFDRPVTFRVRAGNDRFDVTSAVHHPNYAGMTGDVSDYDIGVLTLAGRSSLPPVPIVGSRQVYDGERLAVFGYGLDEEGKGIETYDVNALKATYVKEVALQSNVIITRYDDTETGACEGDSGGPLTAQVNGTTGIVGVVQGGANQDNPDAQGCADGFLDIFTAVHGSSVLNFILSHAPGVQVI